MRVRFWGVRGSCPAPATREDIQSRLQAALHEFGRTSSPPDLSDETSVADWVAALPPRINSCAGGNTPCVEMRTDDGEVFIIDLGTGARGLGHALMEEDFAHGHGRAHIFLSHYHWDHIQGWPFFRPVYVRGNRFDFYTRHDPPEERLRAQQMPPFFPSSSWNDMNADIAYHEMSAEPLLLCDGQMRVTSLELDHPSRAWAYRFECGGKVFVYASDGAYYQLTPQSMQPYVDFFRDADLLIFDAQFTLVESFAKRTWGHSSAVVGVELACAANAKKLALFHHDPSADDAALEHLLSVGEQYSRILGCENRCEILLAREGLSLEL